MTSGLPINQAFLQGILVTGWSRTFWAKGMMGEGTVFSWGPWWCFVEFITASLLSLSPQWSSVFDFKDYSYNGKIQVSFDQKDNLGWLQESETKCWIVPGFKKKKVDFLQGIRIIWKNFLITFHIYKRYDLWQHRNFPKRMGGITFQELTIVFFHSAFTLTFSILFL